MCLHTTPSRWSGDLTLGGKGVVEKVRHTVGTRPRTDVGDGLLPSGCPGVACSPVFQWETMVLQVLGRMQLCICLQLSSRCRDWQE